MTTLPTDIDLTYLDRDPADKLHQQHHDTLHGAYNDRTNAGGYLALAIPSLVNVPAAATDVYGSKFYRNATYTGGTPGFVNSALRVQADVAAGVADYEWGFLSQLNNRSTAGENVAGYHQGNRQTASTGPTWASVSEAIDNSATADPTVGLVGHEVDIRATGTDANHNRIGVDLVVTTVSGATAHGYAALRVSSAGSGQWDNAIVVAGGVIGINVIGAPNVAIDFSAGSPAAALRFKRAQPISWEPTATLQSQMASGSDVLQHMRSGAEKVGLDLSTATPGLRVNAVPVVGTRRTGWATATGTKTRTTFDTTTVTLAALAAAVGALIDDLHGTAGHGLIGT